MSDEAKQVVAAAAGADGEHNGEERRGFGGRGTSFAISMFRTWTRDSRSLALIQSQRYYRDHTLV
jgi:hypothetical protein